MSMKASTAAKPVPDGYHTVTPYLIINGARKALEFYEEAFKAETHVCMEQPEGGIGHAEIKIGDSMVMLADEHPGMGYRGPQALGGTPVSIVLYVENVDQVFRRAISAGATQLKPVADEFWGDRMGTLRDPFGHVWTIATHKEDVSPQEMDARMKKSMAQHQKEKAAAHG